MDWKNEWKRLVLFIIVFFALFYLPVGSARFDNAISEALYLAKWYAREHVVLCLLPAFFIAGAIAVFIRQNAVMKYLGPTAKKPIAYGVASVSGSILAVCSCTVLPLFAGIYRMGAGIGPATAFLYAGPAINVLAIILTAKVLGWKIGLARAIGAILFSIIIGLLMHLIFCKEEENRVKGKSAQTMDEQGRSLAQTSLFFAVLVGILIFANWGFDKENIDGFWNMIFNSKWIITSIFGFFLFWMLHSWFKMGLIKLLSVVVFTIATAVIVPDRPMITFAVAIVGISLVLFFGKGEGREWFDASWEFAAQIIPLLFFGVLIAGALLGRPDSEGLIPSGWVSGAVGGNSILSNLFASVVGAFMYFATLTEVPIIEVLLGSGMGQGPALALLLAGPALSLPNMLVIRSVLGNKKTVVYIMLVIIMATISGLFFGAIV
ncbi:MAG: permease [Acidobacteria bacterium]|nr:permease [Acidobacteriota bacterium]